LTHITPEHILRQSQNNVLSETIEQTGVTNPQRKLCGYSSKSFKSNGGTENQKFIISDLIEGD